MHRQFIYWLVSRHASIHKSNFINTHQFRVFWYEIWSIWTQLFEKTHLIWPRSAQTRPKSVRNSAQWPPFPSAGVERYLLKTAEALYSAQRSFINLSAKQTPENKPSTQRLLVSWIQMHFLELLTALGSVWRKNGFTVTGLSWRRIVPSSIWPGKYHWGKRRNKSSLRYIQICSLRFLTRCLSRPSILIPTTQNRIRDGS